MKNNSRFSNSVFLIEKLLKCLMDNDIEYIDDGWSVVDAYEELEAIKKKELQKFIELAVGQPIDDHYRNALWMAFLYGKSDK